MNTKYIFTSKYNDKEDKVTTMWCSTTFEAERFRVSLSRLRDVIEVIINK